MLREEVERLLPRVLTRTAGPGSPLAALLEAMAQLVDPVQTGLDGFAERLDPYRAPDRFVPWLAGWVGYGYLVDCDDPDAEFGPGLTRLRVLVAGAAGLARLRGTSSGLVAVLRVATGLDGFAVDDPAPGPDGRPRPFHVVVRTPAAAEPYRALIARIVEHEKPAFVTYELARTEGSVTP
jgi:phage tail-like protein